MLPPTFIYFPRNVKCNLQGFSWLSQVAAKLQLLWDAKVVLDATNLQFFDSNLCAPLGALLRDAIDNAVSIELRNVKGEVLKVWSKNEFSRHFGGATMNDVYDTTLAYRQFPLDENPKSFAHYVNQELISKDLPMTEEMRRDFARNIQEIFDNAQSHSQSKRGVFSCGQHFPNRNRLAFTLTDLGVGFRQTVEKRLGISTTDEKAIAWATQTGNSSRLGNGGYGLPLLKEFFARNKGRMQIVSHSGFWELNENSERVQTLQQPFPGSFVNLEINTGDEDHNGTSAQKLAESLNIPLF